MLPLVLFLEALLSKFDLQYHFDWNVQIMPLIDQLLLTLMKLRLNCGILDLATRFNCCRATVTNIFTTISSALYDILYVGVTGSMSGRRQSWRFRISGSLLMSKKRTTSKSYNKNNAISSDQNTAARLSAPLAAVSPVHWSVSPLSVFLPTERQSRRINTHFLIGADCGHLSAIRPNRPSRPGAPYSPYRPDAAPLHSRHDG